MLFAQQKVGVWDELSSIKGEIWDCQFDWAIPQTLPLSLCQLLNSIWKIKFTFCSDLVFWEFCQFSLDLFALHLKLYEKAVSERNYQLLSNFSEPSLQSSQTWVSFPTSTFLHIFLSLNLQQAFALPTTDRQCSERKKDVISRNECSVWWEGGEKVFVLVGISSLSYGPTL